MHAGTIPKPVRADRENFFIQSLSTRDFTIRDHVAIVSSRKRNKQGYFSQRRKRSYSFEISKNIFGPGKKLPANDVSYNFMT